MDKCLNRTAKLKGDEMTGVRFSYVYHSGHITVRLDGGLVGKIKPVLTERTDWPTKGGWAYFPNGSKHHGEVFRTPDEVMDSIESEYLPDEILGRIENRSKPARLAVAEREDKTMKKWTRPDSYIGAEWPDYYVFLGQHKDSDALTRSNFRSALERLGGETGERTGDMFEPGDESPMVTVVRESHWAVGWVEWIAVHESNVEAIRLAEEMEAEIEQYPCLDESDWSELEDEECAETWANCYDPPERVRYFREHSYTASSIADLLRAVRGDWSYAANILHNPSDLLY